MNHDKIKGNELLDFYAELLTPRKKELLNAYFKDDLSMNEIADNLAISKSAVSDTITKSLKQLEDYEAKLHLIDTYHHRLAIYQDLINLNIDEVKTLVYKLYDIE